MEVVVLESKCYNHLNHDRRTTKEFRLAEMPPNFFTFSLYLL